MRKQIPALLLIIITLPVFSKQHTYVYGKYRKGQSVYLWGDNVNVRSAPSMGGRVIGRIGAGTILQVKEVMKQTFSLRGYREPWYRVSYVADTDGRDLRTGFVWGGMIAKAAVPFTDSRSVHQQYLLVGAFGKGAFNKVTEARLLRGERVVARTAFDPIFTDIDKGLDFRVSMGARLLPGRGFPKKLRIFAVDFEYGACDFPNGSVFLVWDGKRLHEAFRLLYASNEEGGLKYRVYLPGQAGTPSGTIRVVYTRYRNAFVDGKMRRTEKKGTVTCLWNGRGFVKRGKIP